MDTQYQTIQDAPSYDATARVLQADGSPALAWHNPGTKVQSFGLKSNRALHRTALHRTILWTFAQNAPIL